MLDKKCFTLSDWCTKLDSITPKTYDEVQRVLKKNFYYDIKQVTDKKTNILVLGGINSGVEALLSALVAEVPYEVTVKSKVTPYETLPKELVDIYLHQQFVPAGQTKSTGFTEDIIITKSYGLGVEEITPKALQTYMDGGNPIICSKYVFPANAEFVFNYDFRCSPTHEATIYTAYPNKSLLNEILGVTIDNWDNWLVLYCEKTINCARKVTRIH